MSAPSKLRPRRVAVLVGEAVSLFEFSAIWDVFGVDPGVGVPWYDVAICSALGPPVPTSCPGVQLTDVRPLSAMRGAGTIIVPPFRSPSEEMLAALRSAHRRGARILSLCTGAFVLAQAGLLDGRVAATHWASAARLAEMFPEITVDDRVLYIDGGDILTSAGSAAGIDLCLHVVRKDFGAEVANTVARELVVAPHRSGGQSQFLTSAVPEPDQTDLFGDTLQWAQSNLDRLLEVETLARRAAMSPRTFARRFRDSIGSTPHQWVLRQRIILAQRLLEGTDLPIDAIASQCGLGSPQNLRAHFRQIVGTSPADYRRTFRAEAV
jgi:transcriptional regulator GlxA family with amidase domain